jgi:adenylate cyclase
MRGAAEFLRKARWLRHASIALASFALLAAASVQAPWRLLELRGYDWLSVATAPGPSHLPIVIVGIDEASFAELNMQWPWPRSLHGRLLDRLNEAGAAVVVFDVIFAEPSADPKQDRALADAIGRAGNVLLASDLTFRETATTREWLRTDPLPAFIQAGAVRGLAAATFDGDSVVRRIPTADDVLWRRAIAAFQQKRPGLIEAKPLPPEALMRYLGPDHTFPYVSYYQALEPAKFLPKDALQDAIVLIGFDVKTSPEPGSSLADMMATPFLGFTRLRTPGVELHATFIENAVTGAAIGQLPAQQGLALLALTVLVATWLMRSWRPVRSTLIALGIVGALVGGALAAFVYLQLWVPVFAAITAVVLVYAAQGSAAFLLEQRQRNQIKRAFGHYVSPLIVEQLANQPEQLRLGGQLKEVCVMFTDLAGFTTISEELKPEDTAKILTRHLTDMTRIVHKYGGTVDKFIGDAVMAFWGAPLDDPEQATHACQAAIEMQQAQTVMREEYLAEGYPELHMRIGITHGKVIVGNMGAEDRFDYTVIGDIVNLAARLEGVNKIYGTLVLVTEAVAQRVNGLPLRPVDKVAVKGKNKAIELFTPYGDPEIIALTRTALTAYRERRWEDSARGWNSILTQYPGDALAQYYVARVELMRVAAPPAEWDGSLALDTK